MCVMIQCNVKYFIFCALGSVDVIVANMLCALSTNGSLQFHF